MMLVNYILVLGLIALTAIVFMVVSKNNKLIADLETLHSKNRHLARMNSIFKLREKDLKTVHRFKRSGNYFCWVNEHGGYYAYCYKDGRLKTRSGYGDKHDPIRTWSTVSEKVLWRELYNGGDDFETSFVESVEEYVNNELSKNL